MGEKPGAQDEVAEDQRKAAPASKPGSQEAAATGAGGSGQPQESVAGAPLKGVDVKLG